MERPVPAREPCARLARRWPHPRPSTSSSRSARAISSRSPAARRLELAKTSVHRVCGALVGGMALRDASVSTRSAIRALGVEPPRRASDTSEMTFPPGGRGAARAAQRDDLSHAARRRTRCSWRRPRRPIRSGWLPRSAAGCPRSLPRAGACCSPIYRPRWSRSRTSGRPLVTADRRGSGRRVMTCLVCSSGAR